MKSITSWLERKLFLKVSATKTKVVNPKYGQFLGFTFWKSTKGWKCRPTHDRKMRLYSKIRLWLKRKHAVARPTKVTLIKVNQIVRGWINYFRIGNIKYFLTIFGRWLRHKIRCIIIKQWKRPKTIYKNLMNMNKKFKCNFSHEDIYKCANSRLGWYGKSTGNVVNYILNPKVLGIKIEDKPGLVNPLDYYLNSL